MGTRQLIKAYAHSIISQLNENLDDLRAVVPSFVEACEKVRKPAEMAAAV